MMRDTAGPLVQLLNKLRIEAAYERSRSDVISAMIDMHFDLRAPSPCWDPNDAAVGANEHEEI